jgi:NRPS condensation-like uncharacterized protein
MKRELGYFETAEIVTNQNFPFNAVGIMPLTDGPSEDTLRKALKRLQHRHALLRVHVGQEKNRFFYVSEGTKEIPLEMRERTSDTHWEEVAEEELNRRLDFFQYPGMRLIYLTKGGNTDECELIVTFQHAIVDASSGTQLLHELFTLCQAIEENREIDEPEQLSLMPSCESLFPASFQGFRRKWNLFLFMLRQIGNEFKYRIDTRKRRKAPAHTKSGCKIINMKLPAELTSVLYKKSRRKRVTLNNLFNAVMMMAAQKHLYDGKAYRLRNFNFSNLRPYLVPPMEPQFMGSYFALLSFDVPIKENPNVWELAAEVNDILYKSLKRGDKFCSSILSPKLMRMIFKKKNLRMGDVAMSFIGNITIGAQYGRTRIRGMHAFVSNFGLGPEFTAHVRMFDKQIYWNTLYLDSDMDKQKARVLSEEVLAILKEAANT